MTEPATTTTDAARTLWSIHQDPSRWPVSSKTFLAEALLLTGAALCEPWVGREPAWMMLPKRSLVPSANDAFKNGNPVANVHAAFARQIRAALSPAAYLLDLIDRDPEGWYADELPYPADQPLAALELRTRNNEDQNDPITPGHWNAAAELITIEYTQLDAANRAMPHVAKFIAAAAVSGHITTYARPFGHGSMTTLDPSLWELDHPLERAATCCINFDEPFNALAPATHFIFVEPKDLETHLQTIQPHHKVCLVPGLQGRDRRGRFPGAENELFEWIDARAELPEHQGWRREDWVTEAYTQLGSWTGGDVFKKAWKAATAKHPGLSKNGRPRNGERPILRLV
jgi:hypothetical protein